MKIVKCKVNHLINPLGFFMEQTVFSWVAEECQGKKQVSARIRIWTGQEEDDNLLADTDWGNLDSLGTMVELKLKPRTCYFWTVAVRTDAGEEAVSETQWFETGLMGEAWQASWICADETQPRHPVFSKEIVPQKAVAAARLHICGLGVYEAAWNGEKIGEEYLTPYCNNYHSWLQYQTFDVTDQLQQKGVLSVTLGNGWYYGRFGFERNPKPYYGTGKKLIAQLVLRYEDGTEEVIGTDESWLAGRSNITFSNIYDGEHRDDTLPQTEKEYAILASVPEGKLTARYSTPVKAWETLEVKALLHTPAGETVLDIGQNIAGSFRLSVHEPKGSEIRLQFGEILQDGNFYQDNLRSAKAEYRYISDGEPHILEPKFTFYGYRYVKIEGVTELQAKDFTALVLYSDLPKTGFLNTGNMLVNQLLSNVEWSQKGNFLDVPTDCPQRDERMGWTGDAQVFSETACYFRDSYCFFSKYLHDMETEQDSLNGCVPDVVPSFGKHSCSAAWGDAACVIPMQLYRMYGDKSILRRQYASMKAWVEYIRKEDGEDRGWGRKFHYGDWLALDAEKDSDLQGGTEIAYVAYTQYRHSVLLLAEAAELLGKSEDAAEYKVLAEELLAYLREEYFTPSGRLAIPTQTGYLLALSDHNAPDSARSAKELKKKLALCDNQLRTGFVGTPMLLPALTKWDMEENAFELFLNEGYLGWLYAVKQGATTIWERWDSVDENGKIAENGMNSLNHYAYGSVAAWLFSDVAGIAPSAPGFRKAKLAPHVHSEIGKAEVRFDSAAGCYQTRWEILPNGDVSYSCTIPFDCEAELFLPYGGGEFLLEAGNFSLIYTPDTALKTVYSTETLLRELLGNKKTKQVLLQIMPQIAQLPPSMMDVSMRALAAKMGVPKELLDRVDTMLAGL